MLESIADLLSGQYGMTGIVGGLLGLMLLGIGTLWRALTRERKRTSELVDKMLEMSAQTATMIERIMSRGSRK